MQLVVKHRQALSLLDIQDGVRGKLKGKEAELFRSIQGFFTDHHWFILKTILETIAMLEAQINLLDRQIVSSMKGHEDLLDRMKEAPGISDVSAGDILAEIGPTLDGFPTDTASVSWSGLCPGNNESAGKRKSGKSPVRKHHLKSIMLEVAWAAIRKKVPTSRTRITVSRLAGEQKSLSWRLPIGSLGVYHVIKDGALFHDLGGTDIHS